MRRAMLACQQDNGALIASPDFAQYHYCWLRDASFAAFALDRCGEHEASARYHDWVNAAPSPGSPGSIDAAIASALARRGRRSATAAAGRFSLDGTVAADDWPNFQIDGYGTWLWALREHLGRPAPARCRRGLRRRSSGRRATSPRSRSTPATTSGRRTATACTSRRSPASTAASRPPPPCSASRGLLDAGAEVRSHCSGQRPAPRAASQVAASAPPSTPA